MTRYISIISVWLNKTKVHNKHILSQAVLSRGTGIPLLTVSNHHSCFDDPGLWGVLDASQCCSSKMMRWSLTAHDICFTNKYHSWFFLTGEYILMKKRIFLLYFI